MKTGEAPHRLNFSCLHTPTQSPLKVGGRWLLCVEVILNRRGGLGANVPNFTLCKARETDTWWQNVENDFSCSLFFIFNSIQQKKTLRSSCCSLTDWTYTVSFKLYFAPGFYWKGVSTLTHRTKCHYLHLISFSYNTLAHIIKWMCFFGGFFWKNFKIKLGVFALLFF